MEKLTLLDNKLITVWVIPKHRLIHHEMKGFCHGEPFREALSAGADAMAKYEATRWLSDDRANGALPPEDEAWATQTWFPRTKAAGWKHWAIVQPLKIVGQMNMARFQKMYADLGINARMFSEPGEAMAWIDAQ